LDDDTKLPRAGALLAGKYRIEKPLREGGMGAILVARHEVLNQNVAVKVLLADAARDEASVARFLREAQSAARIQSHHVARVMDAGTLDNGSPFLVMELLDGCDLGELLKLSGPLPVDEVVDYTIQALEGVAQAHACGIVHRDLKPANLYLALRPDGTNVIKILDFGISKTTGEGEKVKTLTGKAVLGSPAYMSPEQVRNPRTVDGRSDLFSLGVAMYELLTGEIPFDGDGVGEILAAVLERDPIPLRKKRPDVPPALEKVILRCLEKSRDKRYANAAELARALAPHGSGKWLSTVEATESTHARLVRAEAPTLEGQTGEVPPPRRRSLAVTAGAFAVIAILGVVAFVRARGGEPASMRALGRGHARSELAAVVTTKTSMETETLPVPAVSGSAPRAKPSPAVRSRPEGRPAILRSRD
jgi:serine/threonine-protein kinase